MADAAMVVTEDEAMEAMEAMEDTAAMEAMAAMATDTLDIHMVTPMEVTEMSPERS